MKKQILALAAMSAMMDTNPIDKSIYNEPPNGNSRRTRCENTKRKKMRRLKNKAKQNSKL